MRPTRRCWAVAGSALVLLALSVLATRPLLAVGGAAIGAFVLACQYRFLRHLNQADRDLTVDVDVAKRYVLQDEETPLVLEAAVSRPTPLTLVVEAAPPVSARAPPESECRVVLGGEDTTAETTVALAWPVVGRSTFDRPVVTAFDAAGLFRQTFGRGPTPTVTVEPHTPQHVHVGEGGEQLPVAAGEHRAGRFGEGQDPAELRRYTIGDAASDIDWKATARLAEPYVREYEAETDRRSALVVDHRAPLGVGEPGGTKLDYLREVALALVGQAQALEDPLGCYTVGDGGLTAEFRPSTAADQYRTIRTELHDLAVTSEPDGGSATRDAPGRVTDGGESAGGASPPTRRASVSHHTDPATATTKAAHLAPDRSRFGETLRPYFEDRRGYVQRIERDPLFATAKTHLTRLGGPLWTFLFTDDSHPQEVRETVKLARGDTGHVVTFLAPSVLYEPGGLADLEAAYERYVEFESFRRELAQLERVSAYEVGPGDRLGAILGEGRR
jgi:uncharacterized protein (DUF58 family)